MKPRLDALGPLCLAALALSTGLYSCATKPEPRIMTVQGIVFDLDKSPVADAELSLGNGSTVLAAQTDSRGRFTFADVPLGVYSLELRKSEYEKTAWNIEVSNYADVIYLKVASYWQLLDGAASALGRKEWGEAEELLKRAHGIKAQSATELFLLAVLAEKRGQVGEAVALVRRAIAIDDKSAYLWKYLADLSDREGGDPQTAIEALRRYLDIKYDPEAEERLGRLVEEGKAD